MWLWQVRVAVMRDLLGLLPDDGLREDITAVMQANEVRRSIRYPTMMHE